MGNSDYIIQQRYDQMWQKAADALEKGHVDTDSHLPLKLNDNRRGYTLAIRPDPGVRSNVKKFIDEIREIEPDQYFYKESEFHVTLLSLFTATEEHDKYFAQYSSFARAVERALVDANAFAINFRGVTASSGAIIIQGFPEDDTLETLRNAIRSQLISAGLGSGLDKRYVIRTAHMTVVRFQNQLNDSGRLFEFLSKNRQREFGKTSVREALFVENDWYMSEDKIRILAEYNLK